MMARLLRWLRRYLVTGLLVWVPLGVTLLTFSFLLDLADKILTLLPPHWRPDALLGFHLPGLGVIFALVVLLSTGVLLRNLIGSTVVGWWEELLNRIPLVRSIYSGAKGITETLVSDKGGSFSKVVLVEYPRRDMWSIGFVTASNVPEIDAATGEKHVCVYVPTTPNPTSGLIVYVPASQIREANMSVDAAMKMVVTMGMVMPEQKAPAP
jgi:uncharacterized membrane protein